MDHLPSIRRGIPESWICSTNWPSVLVASGPAEQLYLDRHLPSATDKLRRAAACATVLRSAESECSSTDIAPFRVGPVATDSVETFTSLLHAAMAGIEAKHAVADGKTASERMGHAGRAWRHINAAGPWMHEPTLCPPQLTPEFRSKLVLLIMILVYHRTSATAPDSRSEEACMRQVATLHTIIEVCKSAKLPKIGEWASAELQPLIAHCWATYHRDPRRHDTDTTEPDATVAYAICRLLHTGKCQTVEHFIRTHGTVIGGNHERDVQVRRTGAINLVRPILTIDQLEKRALPVAVLDGPVELPGERPFESILPVAPAEDRHGIVLKGIGVVLPLSAIPKPKRHERTGSWLSFRAPTLPSFRSAAPPPPKPPDDTTNGSLFL